MDEAPVSVRELLANQTSMALAAALDQTIYAALRRFTGEETPDLTQLAGRLAKVKRVGVDGETYCLDGTPFLWVSDMRFTDTNGTQNVSFDHKMLAESGQ